MPSAYIRFEYDNDKYRTPEDLINKLVSISKMGRYFHVTIEKEIDSIPYNSVRWQTVLPISFFDTEFVNHHELIYYLGNELSEELGCDVRQLIV